MNLDRVIAVRTTKTIYRDGGLAIKVFDACQESIVLREALNHALIEETGLTVPKLHEVTKLEGRWAIVYEYIAGKTLSRLMRENPDAAQNYLNQLVDIQISIHAKRAPMLNKQKDNLRYQVSRSELDATSRYDLLSRINDMPRYACVCHGDLVPANIIISDGGVPYVLDWFHASKGDPAADVATSYLQMMMNHGTALANHYLNEFCARGDVQRERIDQWLPIIAASQSVNSRLKDRDMLLERANEIEQGNERR